jgi:hypothetical protein
MAAPVRPSFRGRFGASVPLLLVAALALGAVGRLPLVVALPVAAAGVVVGVAMRGSRDLLAREASIVPVLLVLGALALQAPVAPVPGLLAGFAGVAFLVWLTDDPHRPPAGISRGWVEWTLPGVGVALAWSSTLLLPSTAAPVGVAGGLLAASVLALAFLVRQPELFDTDLPATI